MRFESKFLASTHVHHIEQSSVAQLQISKRAVPEVHLPHSCSRAVEQTRIGLQVHGRFRPNSRCVNFSTCDQAVLQPK
jgi:hypothetical protein